MIRSSTVLTLAIVAVAGPALSQSMPGAQDASRIVAGDYKVDVNHTQVFWTVEHMGITPLSGAFGASGGSLQIDPARPTAAKVTVTFNTADTSTTLAAFTKHLSSEQLLDVAKFPTASFTSSSVVVDGMQAKVDGMLTLHGVTKPVTLDMKLYGVGTNPMNKKLEVGFSGTAHIKRSDFGIGYAVPMVSDDVRLNITGAFERVG